MKLRFRIYSVQSWFLTQAWHLIFIQLAITFYLKCLSTTISKNTICKRLLLPIKFFYCPRWPVACKELIDLQSLIVARNSSVRAWKSKWYCCFQSVCFYFSKWYVWKPGENGVLLKVVDFILKIRSWTKTSITMLK